MNSIKKARNHDTFPRVRKRNSIGSNQASHGANNAAQRRASLLRNNKNLALTLQETRVELSVYKNFFDECQDYMSKTKLARSRMVQLSAALKNFVKAFDENIFLLDFDESKWPNIKISSQSNKNFQNGMNPVIEACNEIPEEVSDDQEMNCNEENSPEYLDQMVQSPSSTLQKAADEKKHYDPKRASKSPEKKSENSVKNDKNSELYSESGDAGGNEDIPREVPNSLQNHPNPNSLQVPPPAPVLPQAVKTTKIPRCRPLSVNLKRQNFVKDFRPPNKASKRKSFDKKYEESDPNVSRRKTFVVKSSNVLTESESIRNITDENGLLSKERLNVPEDGLNSKNDKRKTFVLKSSNILRETEPVLSNKIDKELVTESRDHLNETTDMLTLDKNKRKTFVKKSNDKTSLHQNDASAEYQVRKCAVNLESVENCDNIDQSENIKSSSDFHHSDTLTGFAVVKSKQICAESSKKNQLNVEVNSLNMNMALLDISSKEITENDKVSITDGSDASNKAEVIAENHKSKADGVVPDQTAANTAKNDTNIMNEELIFNDKSQEDENSNKVPQLSPVKTRRSFLESSESEMDLIVIDEFDFGDKRPAFKTTPIRRKISKSKKKKFVFDGKKINFETDDNHSQKNMEIAHSDVNAVNNNEIVVNEIKERNGIISVSDENPVNIPSETATVRKKTAKTSSRKNKNSQVTSRKNNTEENSTKLKKVKNNKKNECVIEIDDLISQPKKIKKKNIKKKKKDIHDDDDNSISKFVEVDKDVKLNECEENETEVESDFPCTKTGKNTFLVRAEIHPPPPSFNSRDIKEINKEDGKLNLQHMQVTVVLNDVLKSKNLEFLNISDRDLLCSRAASVKSLSGSSSSFVIDPEESIEKLRCDPVAEADDCDLHSDAILGINHSETLSDPILESENARGRRRKAITYKEPSLNRKLRRN